MRPTLRTAPYYILAGIIIAAILYLTAAVHTP